MLRALQAAVVVLGLVILAYVGWILFTLGGGSEFDAATGWILAVLNLVLLFLLASVYALRQASSRKG